MDDQRQAGLARGLDMAAEHLGLDVARAQVVVEVQPTFADADHAGPLRQLDQIGRRHGRMVLGLMRMGPDGAPDIVMGHGQGVGGLEGRELVRDLDHHLHPGLAGADDDFVAVLIELGRVQIDVAVDDHQPSP